MSIFTFLISFSQNTASPLKVFIDCTTCSHSTLTIVKQELKQVDFVRDQTDSDVHVFFTTQSNASNGKSYEIEFIGQNDYMDLKDVMHFNTNADMTELEVTNKILKYLKLGLMHFWIENGIVDKLSLSIADDKETDKKELVDLWNKWSFSIGVNGWFNGQESSKFSNFNGNISGEQVTEQNKFKFYMGVSKNKSVFIYGDNEIISDKRSNYLSVSDVISINNHWSAGVFSNIGNSVYSNYNLYVKFQPGVEYNFYSYDKSSKEQVVLRYKIGSMYNKYYERTIFNKKEELLCVKFHKVVVLFSTCLCFQS